MYIGKVFRKFYRFDERKSCIFFFLQSCEKPEIFVKINRVMRASRQRYHAIILTKNYRSLFAISLQQRVAIDLQ